MSGWRWNDEPGDRCDDPSCPCHEFRGKLPRSLEDCSLSRPVSPVPPEGAHIPCPAHGKHFVPGASS